MSLGPSTSPGHVVPCSTRARSLRIRTGVASSEPKTVWATRRDDEWEVTNPVTQADLDAAAEAMDRALRGTSET